MLTRTKMGLAAGAAALALAACGTLLAQQTGTAAGSSDVQLAKLMNEHHISLVRAIEAAEQHGRGRAISAAAQMQGSDGVVNVVVVAGESTQRLTVDMKTGKVSEPSAAAAATKRDAAKPREQPKKKS